MERDNEAQSTYESIEFAPGIPAMSILRFKVSAQPVSFHHPLHWFLSHILAQVPLLPESDDGRFWTGVFPFKAQDYEERVVALFEPIIRVFSLLSQIKNGKAPGSHRAI